MCPLVLVVACFGAVLFHDEQFSHRDTGEFYYPLYRRVQAEWAAGRWPLWEPGENGGTPLLGNPTAAVLYPGKLIYALPLPYAWGARLYVIAHVLLAYATMRALLRSWKVSRTGSNLGAIAYAFGAPVLLQSSNIIFLVGAAWTPLGLRSVDRLLRLKARWAAPELVAVLALQTLGGDPEAAYLVVLCGLIYAFVLAWFGRVDPNPQPRRPRATFISLALVLGLLTWIGGTLGAAAWIKARRTQAPLDAQNWNFTIYQFGLIGVWGVAAALGRRRWHDRPGGWQLGRSLVVLAACSLLALGLAGAQVLPVLEFAHLSVRTSGDGQHDVYPFSLEPCLSASWLWPDFFGSIRHGQRNWMHLVPPAHVTKLWVPSLYLGGLTVALALGAARLRGDSPPWRTWLTAIAIGGTLGALGEFASPLWWARAIPGMRPVLGAHDPSVNEAARTDGGIADGDGSFYWLLTMVLPGFQAFRYPAKLLTFTSLALAALAGIGWDRWRDGGHPARAPALFLALSLTGLAIVTVSHDRLVHLLRARNGGVPSPIFGPFDPKGAVTDLQSSLAQGTLVMALGVVLAAAARRGKPWAGPLALIVLTTDLAVANASLIITAPQSLFDRTPELARLIREAERRDPSPGPFRIHRMPSWAPSRWSMATADDRFLEVTEWENATLKPKFAIASSLSYTVSGGTLELADYGEFFGSVLLPLDTARVDLRGAEHGQAILYYMRRGFDLWNTRYFILPMDPAGWQDGSRGFASFLAESEMIAPDSSLLESPANTKAVETWTRDQDWQLLRNKAAYPRAWVVHRARFPRSDRGTAAENQGRVLAQILFANDEFWSDPTRTVLDPHTLAWIEDEDPTRLAPYVPGGGPDPSESVAITRYESQRVEIEARLARPGIVILADVYYPGWNLTVDGRPASILRVNRLMRGVAVSAGSHRIVYTYSPRSFQAGVIVSLVSIGILLRLSVRAIRERPLDPPVEAGEGGTPPVR